VAWLQRYRLPKFPVFRKRPNLGGALLPCRYGQLQAVVLVVQWSSFRGRIELYLYTKNIICTISAMTQKTVEFSCAAECGSEHFPADLDPACRIDPDPDPYPAFHATQFKSVFDVETIFLF
jgi:hypothetical protein